MNQDLQVSDWLSANAHHPALPGLYEVRNTIANGKRSVARLISRFRYWDGARWLTEDGRFESSFGEFAGHQWRGVRRWSVCTTQSSTRFGEPAYIMAINAGRRRTIELNVRPEQALSFACRTDAENYIGRFPRFALAYDLQAVLA